MTRVFNFKETEEYSQSQKVDIVGYGDVGETGCPAQTPQTGTRCNSMNIRFTGKLYNHSRVYTCHDCKSMFVSPTTYARCDNEYIVRTKEGVIARDLIVNDCFICPIPKKEGFDVRKLVAEGKHCPYFKEIIKLDN